VDDMAAASSTERTWDSNRHSYCFFSAVENAWIYQDGSNSTGMSTATSTGPSFTGMPYGMQELQQLSCFDANAAINADTPGSNYVLQAGPQTQHFVASQNRHQNANTSGSGSGSGSGVSDEGQVIGRQFVLNFQKAKIEPSDPDDDRDDRQDDNEPFRPHPPVAPNPPETN
jgi:hypothetical protein